VDNPRLGELAPTVLALLHPLQDFQTYCRARHDLAVQAHPVTSSSSSRSSLTSTPARGLHQ
jgi:hypothetical protein